jgi:hypothetical protein
MRNSVLGEQKAISLQFDSAGFSAGYCFYAIIQAETKKVIAFTVATKDMVSYSAMMGTVCYIVEFLTLCR